MREDFQPVRLPWTAGEFANVATSVGPISWRACQRSVTAVPSPASRQTCTADVEHIMVRPCGPTRSNAASIAA
jgi:hypothetical protein